MAVERAFSTRLPWNDRKGAFSPLKAATLALVSAPGLWILWQALAGNLGPRPFTEAIHQAGDYTIYLLLVTLAITPARHLFQAPRLILVRRIVGLSALAYILLHFFLYIADSRFNLVFVATEIALRIYLLIGFVAILGLVALGVTSTDGMIRRLGAMRWNRLHRLIYLIATLGILHYYMQSKIDVSQPVIMTGFFLWLMGWRLLHRLGWKDGLLPLLALSVAAALLTALAEALWYGVATGVGWRRPLLANLDFAISVRPAWTVLFVGLGVTAASETWRRLPFGGRRTGKPATA